MCEAGSAYKCDFASEGLARHCSENQRVKWQFVRSGFLSLLLLHACFRQSDASHFLLF
jgi:hypothetical protein